MEAIDNKLLSYQLLVCLVGEPIQVDILNELLEQVNWDWFSLVIFVLSTGD